MRCRRGAARAGCAWPRIIRRRASPRPGNARYRGSAEAALERRAIDAEAAGGERVVATGLVEHAPHVPALDLAEGRGPAGDLRRRALAARRLGRRGSRL